MFKLLFSGEIKKADLKSINGKAMVELSICKKNKTKEGEEASFTWIKCAVWDCPEWLAPKLVKGTFVAGCGDFTLRSYPAKDGTKGVSADVRCSGYDITVADDGKRGEAAQTYTPTTRSEPKVNVQIGARRGDIADDPNQTPF
jgi:single-stranded DNA-binding protein